MKKLISAILALVSLKVAQTAPTDSPSEILFPDKNPYISIECILTDESKAWLPGTIATVSNDLCSSLIDSVPAYVDSHKNEGGYGALLVGYNYEDCHVGTSITNGLPIGMLRDVAQATLNHCRNKTTASMVHGIAHLIKAEPNYIYLGGEFQPVPPS